MRIRGVIAKEEIEEKLITESDLASIVAYDTDTQEIVGKFALGKKNEFEMNLKIKKGELDKILFLWQCAADTVLNQIHPKITTL